uniref:Uncharacterized protein n=1 Tax=Setaria viridis TaxID=4556 RepID=A0A4U6TB14_SETVI|nr:hypothetical protein SEVIR_9G514950v2 [Setaria viridis]
MLSILAIFLFEYFLLFTSCSAIFHSLPTPSRLGSCRAVWFLRITLCEHGFDCVSV